MTRKDYDRAAQYVREMQDAKAQVKAAVVEILSNLFEQDNPRVDRARFLEACGLSTEGR